MSEGERVRHQTFLQRTTAWIPAGVIGLLMLPLLLTNRTFGDDWTLHLWLVRQQQINIQANGRPGLFISARPLGVFYPIFVFAGSGLYSVGGYLAIVLGGRPILAYKLLYLAGLCLAYGGMTWLSWHVGLRGWRSQIPGLVFVTGGYFVTDMFARGDLGELMALSAIPFLMAAVTAAMTSRRLKPGYLLAVLVSVFLFTGSHNITLLFGTVFFALLVIVLLGARFQSPLARLRLWRLPAVLASAAIGGGLNAWYLLADVKYSGTTRVANVSKQAPPLVSRSQWGPLLDPLTRPSHLFGNDARPALPMLFAVWILVVAVVAWHRIDGVARRVIVLLAGLACGYVVLIVARTPWTWFPHALYNIQFTWRLHAYVLLATALLMMSVLVWHARMPEAPRRATSAMLAAIAVFTVGAATWQAWAVPSTHHIGHSDVSAPSNFADTVVGDTVDQPAIWYGFDQFRLVNPAAFDLGYAHQLVVPEEAVRGSSFTGLIYVRAGPLPFRTNISAGPPLVTITGITPVGITESGFVVAERTPGTALTGLVDVSIHQGQTRLLRFGASVSKTSLKALAALVAWTVLAWLWPWMAAIARRFRKAQRPTTA